MYNKKKYRVNLKKMAYQTKKKRKVKEMKGKECTTCGETQHNVPKSVEENKKIKPKEVFAIKSANYQNKSKK
jgi:succinate dehydrogenase/fumarate reductase-like Fe-S protein